MSELAVVAPEFSIVGVEPDPFAATPLLRFSVDVADESGRRVYTIALTAQIHIDADRRSYAEGTRGKLRDLFGEPERLPQTATSLMLARADTLVPSFRGTGSFTIDLACTGDLELATTRYLAALDEGTVPLTFLFSGTIFYRGDEEQLQLVQVPWSAEARYRLRVQVWRDLMQKRYAGSGFVRLQAETLELLRERRARKGLLTLDETIVDALRGGG